LSPHEPKKGNPSSRYKTLEIARLFGTIINPTAMLLSGAMLLEYLGYVEQARLLEVALEQTYRQGTALPHDQGGNAGTKAFVEGIEAYLADHAENVSLSA